MFRFLFIVLGVIFITSYDTGCYKKHSAIINLSSFSFIANFKTFGNSLVILYEHKQKLMNKNCNMPAVLFYTIV